MQQGLNETAATTASVSPGMGSIGEAVHDSLQYATASAVTLASEPMFYWNGLLRDIGHVLSRLGACRSPLEVLALQQNFAVSRFEAWMDLGTRWLECCVINQAKPRPGPGALILPE